MFVFYTCLNLFMLMSAYFISFSEAFQLLFLILTEFIQQIGREVYFYKFFIEVVKRKVRVMQIQIYLVSKLNFDDNVNVPL